MSEEYNTVEKPSGPTQIKEKGSRFISYCCPVTTREEAETLINEKRKHYHDATHVCYSYRIGEGEEKHARYNDDGEPSGTAGIPIYNEIKYKDLYNIIVLVIRYYGGVKLGTGGLARAYRAAAKEVLETARIITVRKMLNIEYEFPFFILGEFMRLINVYEVAIKEQWPSETGVVIFFSLPGANFQKLRDTILEKSGGKVDLNIKRC